MTTCKEATPVFVEIHCVCQGSGHINHSVAFEWPCIIDDRIGRDACFGMAQKDLCAIW